MKAWIATGRGSLDLAELDEPRPGPEEAVVAVEAFSPNRGETFVLERGTQGFRPGKDIAGVVIEPATSGRGPRAGDRVVAHLDDSGWAERAAVPIDRLAVLPEAIDSIRAAALPLAGLTALRLTRVTGPLASRRLILTGASGGVGHYFAEMAAAQGADVTVIAADERRSCRLIELGASCWATDVGEAAGRFDIALDSVGGQSTAALLAKLTDRGLLVWFGQASRTAPTLDFFDWSGGSSATIRKFLYTDDETEVVDDLAALLRLTSRGRLHPEVGRIADWRETPKTIQAIVGRRVRGNAVLVISPDLPARYGGTFTSTTERNSE